MRDCEEFYELRDPRTVEYGGSVEHLSRPVALVVGAGALQVTAGRDMVRTLVDLLVRVHRNLALVVPGSVAGRGQDIVGDAEQIALAANPCVNFTVADHLLANAVAIGIGPDAPDGLIGYAGALGWTAILGSSPQALSDTPSTKLGGSLAACLLAARAFRAVHGLAMADGAISLWDLEATGRVQTGPPEVPPMDLGDVLVVGAGAVGSALCHWTSLIDLRGSWEVIDGDDVEVHNTNRSIGLLPRHAGWPTGEPINKAEAVAESLGFTHQPLWYDEWIAQSPSRRPDLVIPAANERGVRQLIQQRGEPILLHATTTRSWQAQLHRHIPGTDECIACRFPDTPTVTPQCSTGPITTRIDGNDAALPFISSGAALLLLVALFHLQAGTVDTWRHNLSSLSFVRTTIRRSFRPPVPGCAHVVSAPARRHTEQHR